MTSNLPREHRYRFKGEYVSDRWVYLYSVITCHGAMCFRVSDGPTPNGGLEAHHRQPPTYMADRAPSHETCPVLGGPACWHEGTVRYATEALIDRWQQRQSETEVFGWLVSEVHHLIPKTEAVRDDR